MPFWLDMYVDVEQVEGTLTLTDFVPTALMWIYLTIHHHYIYIYINVSIYTYPYGYTYIRK
jgi:hypothetical protein